MSPKVDRALCDYGGMHCDPLPTYEEGEGGPLISAWGVTAEENTSAELAADSQYGRNAHVIDGYVVTALKWFIPYPIENFTKDWVGTFSDKFAGTGVPLGSALIETGQEVIPRWYAKAREAIPRWIEEGNRRRRENDRLLAEYLSDPSQEKFDQLAKETERSLMMIAAVTGRGKSFGGPRVSSLKDAADARALKRVTSYKPKIPGQTGKKAPSASEVPGTASKKPGKAAANRHPLQDIEIAGVNVRSTLVPKNGKLSFEVRDHYLGQDATFDAETFVTRVISRASGMRAQGVRTVEIIIGRRMGRDSRFSRNAREIAAYAEREGFSLTRMNRRVESSTGVTDASLVLEGAFRSLR